MKNKRFLSMVLAVVLVASLFTGFAATASADGDMVEYAVKSGDYMYKICKNQGLDYYACKNAIMILNGFTSETQLNRIYVGQKIKLPASNAAAATVKTTTSTTTTIGGTTVGTTTTTTTASGDAVAFYLVPHAVASGETLASICNGIGTSYAQYANKILAMNGIKSVTRVYAGKTVYIPVTSVPTGTYYTVVAHKVVSGDTMTSICNAYGMNYNSNYTLVNGLNEGTNLNSIKVGQTVYVPTSKSVSGGTGASSVPSTGSSAAVNTGNDINIVIKAGGANGSPYALVNGNVVSRAAATSKVTICGGANEGYALEIVSVERKDSLAKVSFNSTDNSFTMPNCGVKVTVKYVAASSITKSPAYNGSFETYVNNEAVRYALKDQKVEIKVSPNSGFQVESVSVKKVADNSDVAVSLKDGVYSFVMGDYDVKVAVKFESAKYYKLKLSYNSRYGSAKALVDGVETTEIAAGTYVTIKATPVANYNVSSLTVTGVKNEDIQHTNDIWGFTMPKPNPESDPVEVSIVFSYGTAYSITSNSLTGGGYSLFEVAGAIQTIALPGQTVKVIPQPDGGKVLDYAFTRIVSNNATVGITDNGDGTYSFVMPEANVAVYSQFKDSATVVHTVCQDGNVSFGVWVDGTQGLKASKGQNVEIRVPGEIYCTGVQWLDNNGNWNNATNVGEHAYRFPMPDYDAYVRVVGATSEVWVNASVITPVGGLIKVTVDGVVLLNSDITTNASVLAGKTLEITVTPDAGKTCNTITITKNDGAKVVVGTTYSYTVSFKDQSTGIKIEASIS